MGEHNTPPQGPAPLTAETPPPTPQHPPHLAAHAFIGLWQHSTGSKLSTAQSFVLAALREGRVLSAKEKTQHTQGLVGVLRGLHDELDAAVLCAYGLPPGRIPTPS